MEKEKEFILIRGCEWPMYEDLSDFYRLVEALREKGSAWTADGIEYLIERVKLAENKLKGYEKHAREGDCDE